jgi:hypothetical protein
MKKQILNGLIFFSSILTVNAQWNGIDPNPLWTNSNVGIGTQYPLSAMHLSNSSHSIYLRMGAIGNTLYETAIRTRFMDGNGSYLDIGSYAGSSNFNSFLTITPAGNIGIGTTEAMSALHLSNSNHEIYLRMGAIGDNRYETAIRTRFVDGYGSFLDLGSFGGNSTTFNSLFTIDPMGRVGIGINPDRKLTVLGEIGINNGDVVFNTSGKLWDVSPNGNDLVINETGLRTPIYLQAGGNVGIGTLHPGYILDVNGTIHTKEVKVDLTGWSDFVFAPTYQLRPLSEVEKYVKTNSHLPEIPSAAEVTQNGLSLGEMQNKLLQKVEELTLYAIEQDKKILEQDKRLEDQNRKNTELKLEIDELKKLISY